MTKRIRNQLNANAETHSSVCAKILAVFTLTDRQFNLGISLAYYTTYTYNVSRDSPEGLPSLSVMAASFFPRNHCDQENPFYFFARPLRPLNHPVPQIAPSREVRHLCCAEACIQSLCFEL